MFMIISNNGEAIVPNWRKNYGWVSGDLSTFSTSMDEGGDPRGEGTL